MTDPTCDLAMRMELVRRIGFAKGQIREALGLVEIQQNRGVSGSYYIDYIGQALDRALDELDGKTVAGKVVKP